jgi:hypothetical protein
MKVIYDTKNTQRKLWIVGDSFTGVEKDCWISHILKYFDGNSHHVSSSGSRDMQTILDIFLRNLHRINKNDLVILCIPTAQRVRLPRKTPKDDVELSNELVLANHKEEYKDYFIGLFNYQENIEGKELEEPLTGVAQKQLDSESHWTYSINSSIANKLNFQEIISSLKKSLPFELYTFSWSYDFDSKIIESKEFLSSKFNWESLHNEYERTGGKSGFKDNGHWSINTHFEFGNYIISIYPEYFKEEVINEIKYPN